MISKYCPCCQSLKEVQPTTFIKRCPEHEGCKVHDVPSHCMTCYRFVDSEVRHVVKKPFEVMSEGEK